MKILITGNMGYIGSALSRYLRTRYPDSTLIGLDAGFFAVCLTNANVLPEVYLDTLYRADVRRIDPGILTGIDAVVHLAAISNDPMGKEFEAVTDEINHQASIRLAQAARSAGVKAFVFASSCSVYGAASDEPRTEHSPLNPLTAYARSKVDTENGLKVLADSGFTVTCLRFATACGMSERLRLDLVLNDFVAGAIADKKITILSDGTPWRPLIAIDDMCRAIDWALSRDAQNGGEFLAVNAGRDEWNYQVIDLAEAVARIIPGTAISINKHAAPDKRSYRVSFKLFKNLAPHHGPEVDLEAAIRGLKRGLQAMGFNDAEFRTSKLMRLKMLNSLRAQGLLSDDLTWKSMPN